MARDLGGGRVAGEFRNSKFISHDTQPRATRRPAPSEHVAEGLKKFPNDAALPCGFDPDDKRRESLRGVCVACLPAAYEVSCRIRAGSPTGLWPDSPRTVASRRFGSPVPRRRGLGGKSPRIGGAKSLPRDVRHVNVRLPLRLVSDSPVIRTRPRASGLGPRTAGGRVRGPRPD